MTEDGAAVELTLAELRDVAGFAAACARGALEVFAATRADDDRPRSAVEAAEVFADGGPRTKALRDAAWAAQRAAHDARDAGALAADAAARAALAAAGAAFLHPLAKATQVKHVVGAGAYAARAFELAAADDRTVGEAHVVRAWAFGEAAVVDVLRRYPAAPDSGGRIGELSRALDAMLRAPDAPASPRLLGADAVTWALQALVGVRPWSAATGPGGALTLELGGRLISPSGAVRGEFRLDVRGAWMIRRADVVQATSDDARDAVPAATDALTGSPVTGIALSADGRALRLELDGATTLVVVPEPLRELATHRWDLCLPDGLVIRAGPGPLLRLVDEPSAGPGEAG